MQRSRITLIKNGMSQLVGMLFIISALSGHSSQVEENQTEYNEVLLKPTDRFKRALQVPGQHYRRHHEVLWDYVVPFEFPPGLGDNVKKTYCEAMSVISSVSCVQFRPRSTEPDYLQLTDRKGGCKSWLGRRGGGQKVWLQNPQCVHRGVAIHELLHAMGMDHEHQRYDRDQYIYVNVSNIMKVGLDNIFDRSSPYDLYRYHNALYDLESIMHYSSHAFAIGDDPTIVPLHALPDHSMVMGQRDRLSKGDIQRIRKMYHCDALATPMSDLDEAFENQLNREYWRLKSGLVQGSGSDIVNDCLELLAPELFMQEEGSVMAAETYDEASEKNCSTSVLTECSGTSGLKLEVMELLLVILMYYSI
jgi:hypothetical protein